MSKTLTNLLITARKMDKLVPVKHLVKHGLNEFAVIELEDAGLLTVQRCKEHGQLIILTSKGYRQFA